MKFGLVSYNDACIKTCFSEKMMIQKTFRSKKIWGSFSRQFQLRVLDPGCFIHRILNWVGYEWFGFRDGGIVLKFHLFYWCTQVNVKHQVFFQLIVIQVLIIMGVITNDTLATKNLTAWVNNYQMCT